MSEKLQHTCESCGCSKPLTSEEAFSAGWDYPPRMGVFGILGPRTCPDCTVDKTVWWAVMVEGKTQLTPEQLEVVQRVKGEPESLKVEL